MRRLDGRTNILIVEDEQNISGFLTAILETNGYGTACATTGKQAISMAAVDNPDLILLDLGLPDIDGMRVLKGIREWSDTPLIVVSARESEHEKVEALDAGASDYITKPFGNNELLARIRSVVRMQKKISGKDNSPPESFSVGGLAIDYLRRTVTVNGSAVHLTPIEYKIVTLLSQNAGKVLTHDYIIRSIWGPFESDNQVLRVNMANIRRKLEINPADPKYILTEVRVGYRMIDIG